MRRIVIAFMSTLSGLVLLMSYPTSTNAGTTLAAGTGSTGSTGSSGSTGSGGSTGSSGSSGSTGTSSSGTKTYTGDAVDTRWGTVQVRITVSDGKITQSEAVQYPNGNGRDVEINNYALPVLAQEVVSAQSANIDAVSGATVTSDGYTQSLQSAIDQAHL